MSADRNLATGREFLAAFDRGAGADEIAQARRLLTSQR
jgi:hypothetical protein